ncbi:monocarboxylate transporter 12-like [Glandiceps talaboti]
MSKTREQEHQDVGEPPDGGYGWIIAISGMMVLVLNGGAYNASGIFLVEFIQYFQQGAEDAAWIGAVFGFIYMSSGPLSAALTKRFGTRVVLMIGGILSLLGFVLSVFAPSLAVLYFTFGGLVGIGFGIPLSSVVIHINKYFSKRFVFANGLCYLGGGIGLLIASPLFHFLIEMFGWRGAVLIIGGINANTMVCAALMRPLHTMNSSRKPYPLEDVELPEQKVTDSTEGSSRGNYDLKNDSVISHTVDTNLVTGELDDTKTDLHTNYISIIKLDEVYSNGVTLKQKLHNAVSFFGLNLFVKSPAFCVICFAQLLEGLGFSMVTSHLVNRAFTSGISKFDSAMLLTYFACASLVARLTHGFIIYYEFVSPTRLLGIAIGTHGLAILLNPITNNYAVLATLACILGLSSGTYQPLIAVSMREQVGVEDTGVALGWDYFSMGIGFLLGPYFSGWMFDVYGNYELAFYITGGLTLTGGILIFLAPKVNKWTKRCSREDTTQKEILDISSKVNNPQTIVHNPLFADKCTSPGE